MATCPNCGAALEHEDDRFCGVCGAAIPSPAGGPPSFAPADLSPAAPRQGRSKVWIYVAVVAAALVVLGVVACIAIVGGSTICSYLQPIPVGPQTQPQPQPQPGTTGATLTLENASSQTICYVYISPSTESTWGNDQMGSSETVPPGGSRTFTGIPSGTYDLRADDCSHNQIDVQISVGISGAMVWTVR